MNDPTVRLSEKGLAKLDEARRSGVEQLPDWLREDMDLIHATAASKSKAWDADLPEKA